MPGTRRARPSPGAAITSSPWIVVSIGVIVMVVLLVVALGSVRGRRTFAEAPPPAPTISLPQVPVATPTAPGATTRPPAPASGPVVPGLSPRSTVLPARPAPRPSASASGSGSRPAAPPPAAPPPVTGRYGVVSSFDGGFVGEVRLVNATGAARGWTVRLAFPRGRLVAVWVSGAEQGRGGFTDGVLTYRSGVDLAPGASVALQFHFEQTGTTRPSSCTVDGAACSGL
ncbi:cellulose binding domain-containing protein [Micromonospora chaiyaphumensis]|uniref:Cellulose binding domain-containing protein n=1 Tax=Micromonospora chaiyaphumensis TaxID=307119 RepID=A0A1C4UYJ4_9ACTN|nr:cellulose binding domain-containing protein [Micromonospora chaiyaphumensis]SCE76840.1 Cellulose binding domain-containing protein [Micromonospora chaiyaphumensis]